MLGETAAYGPSIKTSRRLVLRDVRYAISLSAMAGTEALPARPLIEVAGGEGFALLLVGGGGGDVHVHETPVLFLLFEDGRQAREYLHLFRADLRVHVDLGSEPRHGFAHNDLVPLYLHREFVRLVEVALHLALHLVDPDAFLVDARADEHGLLVVVEEVHDVVDVLTAVSVAELLENVHYFLLAFGLFLHKDPSPRENEFLWFVVTDRVARFTQIV